jgi:polysaccharide pyruvyl transferase WcaK-like protein
MAHLLIVNQHGENRGDEAAMNAMLASLKEEIGEVRFTVLYQFRDRALQPRARCEIEALPIVLPRSDYLRAALFSAALALGIRAPALLPASLRRIWRAYRSADLVLSAPGGPYFGDLYADHEIVHWWYVWLAAKLRLPLLLYAPSAGPFRKRLLNPLRRRLFRRFDTLVTREEASAEHLRALLGEGAEIHVTADSAIQQEFAPRLRHDYFRGERARSREKFLVATSLIQYRFPRSADAAAAQRRYESAMLELLEHLARKVDAHLLLFPQLYGAAHGDAPFLEEMGSRLSPRVSWEVVDPALDSDEQRRLFAMCDLHLASRYHPAIFGHTALVPGLCIYYEHKALGFMTQLGLERFAFAIDQLDPETLKAAADELLRERAALVEHLRRRVPELRQRARETTRLAVRLLHRAVEAHGASRP